MKRSDMVKLLSDIYYDVTVNCDCPENYSVSAAESILDVIEEAGMLPPRWVPIADSTEMGNGGMFNADNDNYPKGHYNVANGKSIYCGVINSWEPEDEEHSSEDEPEVKS